jgi:peptidoglycan/xylan/chitin deacetylase (PgdA/CDA1 family)
MSFIICGGLVKLAKLHSFFGVYRVNTAAKVVALTYDDGPNPQYTYPILQVLARHHAKATFYAVGKNIEIYTDTVKSIMAAGHELGNHSYEHKYMAFRSWRYITNEVDKTDRLLQDLGVTGEIDFRPPWGRRFLLLPLYVHQKHKRLVIWDIDSSDWDEEYTAEGVADKVIGLVKPGSIILMHDGGGDHTRTIAATDLILTQLEQQGYQFVTVADLFNKYADR